MPLTWSQKRAYKDVIDIYAGELDLSQAADGFVKGKGVPALIYSDVKCLVMQTDYDAQPTSFGRAFKATLLTNDSIELAADQPIEDAQFAYWKTSDGHIMNKWFAIAADPQTWPSSGAMTSNYKVVRTKECIDPTAIPADADVA